MEAIRLRGNVPVLFLLFFGLTTFLGGAMYEAYNLYAGSAGSSVYGLAAIGAALGFAFSLLVTARILYKAAR